MTRSLLLIDDNAQLQEQFQNTLSGYSVAVERLPLSESSLDQAVAGNYDAIVISVELPDKLGFGLWHKAKKMMSAPMVLATSSLPAEGFDKHQRLRSHADGYLDLRVEGPEGIVAILDRLLGLGAPADAIDDIGIEVEEFEDIEVDLPFEVDSASFGESEEATQFQVADSLEVDEETYFPDSPSAEFAVPGHVGDSVIADIADEADAAIDALGLGMDESTTLGPAIVIAEEEEIIPEILLEDSADLPSIPTEPPLSAAPPTPDPIAPPPIAPPPVAPLPAPDSIEPALSQGKDLSAQLQAEIDRLLEVQRAQTEALAEMQARLTQAQEEREGLEQDLLAQNSSSGAQASQVEAARAELESSKAQLEAANAELAAQQAQLSEADAEIAAQKAKLEAANAELQSQQTQSGSIDAQLESQKAQLAAANEEIASQQAQLEVANTEVSSQQALLESTKAELDAARSSAAASAEATAKHGEEIERLKGEFERDLENRIQEVSAEHAEELLHAKSDFQREWEKKLQEQLAAQQKQHDTAKKEALREAQQLLESKVEESISLLRKEHEAEVSTLKDRDAAQTRHIEELDNQLAQLGTLESALKEETAASEAARQEVEQLRAQLSAQTSEAQQAIEKIEAEFATTKSELEEARVAAKKAFQERGEARDSLASLRTEFDALVESSKEELIEQESALRTAHENSLKEQAAQSASLVARHEEEVAALTKALEAKESELGEALNLVAQVKEESDQEIAALGEQLDGLEADNSKYQAQVVQVFQKLKRDESTVLRAKKAMAIALTILDDADDFNLDDSLDAGEENPQ